MPVLPTYPGVYIEEIPSGVRTIIGVATSITAFIGRAKKGPHDQPVTIFSFGDYERSFGGLWNNSTMSFAVRDFFLNGGTQAVIVRVHKNAVPARIRIPTGFPPPNDELSLVALSPGTWGDSLSVKIDYKTKTPGDTSLFNITISEENGANEKFFNVSLNKTNSGYLPRVLDQGSTLMNVDKDTSGNYLLPNQRPVDTGTTAVTTQHPLASPPMSPPGSPPGSALTQSSDGDQITDNELYAGTNMQADKEGMYALENTDLFNLLCIPPYAASSSDIILAADDKPTDVTTALIAAADTYCITRRAVFLVDSHSTWNTLAKADTSFTTLNYPNLVSNYSTIFFPRLKEANSLMKNQIEEFVPCGAVAGIISRTDAQRGVWKSPAGLDASLKGVTQLSVPLTDDENGVLNKLGINCLRSFPVYGSLVWGS